MACRTQDHGLTVRPKTKSRVFTPESFRTRGALIEVEVPDWFSGVRRLFGSLNGFLELFL